jgi:hypothetical protein
MNGVLGEASATLLGSELIDGGGTIWCWPVPAEIDDECAEVGTSVAVWSEGVGGPEEEGDSGSVTQSRWLLVATSLATMCARVFIGVTWNTGKESLPSIMPRFERMYETKCMQVFLRRGSEEDLVRSFTSTTEILPTTFEELSMTANDETPSFRSRVKASAKGLSPLVWLAACLLCSVS